MLQEKDVRHIAKLARIALNDQDTIHYAEELKLIFSFIDQLQTVNVEGVKPLTSVVPQTQRLREDVVTEGNNAALITKNAPHADENFFLVPKVVE